MDVSIATLEEMAGHLMAPPNEVSAEARHAADNAFQVFKKTMTIEDIRHILQSTNNQFVLFQLAQALGEVVVKSWPLLSQEQVQTTYKMVVEYVATTDSLANYVVAEFLRSVAMILKRGVIDKKCGEREEVFQMISNLLRSDNSPLQAIGCQFIASIAEQFSSSWRNTQFSITWDFHVKAKTEFENTGLRILLEMSLETLHILCNQAEILNNEFQTRLCEKFLEVAESIFSWNFSTRLLRKFFAISQTSHSFRPPQSWKDLLDNPEFYTLFFKLHSRIRSNESLACRSLNCLVQLSGLTGDCVQQDGAADKFVQMFVSNLLDLFPQGPLPHEINHFCTIINRLFLFRPVQSIMRLPADLRKRFFLYLTQFMKFLTEQALTKAIGTCDHADHTSLTLLYDAWVMFLRSRWSYGFSDQECDIIEQELIAAPTLELVNQFILSLQSPPVGVRPIASEEDDDDDNDDRVLFNDLLVPMSTMIVYNVSHFTQSSIQLLRERINELTAFASGSSDLSRLQLWQEDMHWLMLIIANSVVSEDIDGSCCLAQEVYEYSTDLCQQRGRPFDEDYKQRFLIDCIENPTAQRPMISGDIDPSISLIGELLAWSSLELQMLSNDSANHMVSPELTRSSLLCLKRFISAASHLPVTQPDDPMSVPVLHPEGPFNEILVKFVLRKVFTILNKFGGEEKLCKDAVDLLFSLTEHRAASVASSPELFECLSNTDIARLPGRSSLIKSLVQVAAAANSQELQERMYVNILVPLSDRFNNLCNEPSESSGDSSLVDLLQCFDGVAQASDSGSASTLAGFLRPIITRCVELMKSRANCQPCISAILRLVHDITTKVTIYLIDGEDIFFCEAVVKIVDLYRSEQSHRFVTMTSDDEDKAADLVLFMKILSNVLSKDLLEGNETTIAMGAQVAIMSLQMLLSVMTESVLEIPDVAVKLYRLVALLVQFSPETLQTMPPDLLGNICQCIKSGITSRFGTEICSLSLEALGEIALYMSKMREGNTVVLIRYIGEFFPLTFNSCLEYSCDNSLFADAANALYALICFDRSTFDAYIRELLAKDSNKHAADHLRQAFSELLPDGEVEPSRQKKLAFRRRMETFLNNIQGLLTTDL